MNPCLSGFVRSPILGLVVAALGCGSSMPPPPVPAPPPKRMMATECRDWVTHEEGSITWEPDGDDDAIVTFKGTSPDSDFFAFKGAGPVDAPIAKVANVLIDTSRHHEWVPNFGGMRVVREPSRLVKVIYRHVTTPAIISDRDFVVEATIGQDEASGHLLLQFHSVEDPLAPEHEDRVRGVLHRSGYRMWPIDGGTRTMVIFSVHVDPMGDVPAWIVNLFQSNYARSNIENIRRQAAKADVDEHPEVAAEMKDYRPACTEPAESLQPSGDS